MTINAVEAAHRHLKVSAFNSYRLPIEQGISQLISGCP
jgi:hypothetical protein